MGNQAQKVVLKRTKKTGQKKAQPDAVHAEQPEISRLARSAPLSVGEVLDLQSTAGNRATAQYLQAQQVISQPGDRYEQEAEQKSSQVMNRSANHRADEPLPVQKFSGGKRSPTDAAPPSVNQALTGPGQPLEPGLRAEMEQGFGHDFSGVQVHTGEQAEQSAREIDALAYTVGDNIVFNQGAYMPETQEGQKLIAHELTHVVQQSGSGNGRQIARKHSMSLDGWGSNWFGDDDSKVTFTPKGDFKTAGFQREMESLKNEDFLVQFAHEQMGLKAGEYAHSEMMDDEGKQGTLKIKAGKKGQVIITVHAAFFMDEKSNDTYTSKFTGVWDVEADLKGKLIIRPGKAWQTKLPGKNAPFQLSSFNVQEDQDGGLVRVAAQYNSYQIGDVPTSIGGTIGSDKKGIGGGINITPGDTTTYPAGTIQPPFELKLEVVDIPEPKGEVTIGPVTAMWNSESEVFFNRENNYKLDEKDEIALVRWYNSLSTEARMKIEAGTQPIDLQAFTSTTGKVRTNRELSQKRAKEVIDALGSVAGNNAKFNYKAFGELNTPTDDNVKDPKWLKVVVSTQDEFTSGNQTP